MEEQQQKSWFKRNWLWFVPTVGCGTLIILFFLGIGALIFGVTGMMSDATPTKYAIEKASNHQIVINQLGTPIEQKGLISGEINFSNNDGSANLNIPVKGPNGKAIIYVVAEKVDGEWYYEKLLIRIKETGEKINLLEKSLEGI
ncbi:cytochrome c oxidase assembly factor Coa1 family protein [Pseudotenacibaculum sp. MALMAid0570]|uniref:cytochrome c oxidase assembly factor Coa1 family protein n=1 Tax=Pseudotenacibaculum sp. MALMAid0570 TaxID=3143938 RepID=UPI0032DECF0C